MVVSYSAVENQYSVLGREQQWKICWWEGGNGESRRERDGYRSDYESSDDQSMVHCPLVSLNYQSSIKLKSVISRCLQQLDITQHLSSDWWTHLIEQNMVKHRCCRIYQVSLTLQWICIDIDLQRVGREDWFFSTDMFKALTWSFTG